MKTKSINEIREQEQRIKVKIDYSKRKFHWSERFYDLVIEIANNYVRNIKQVSPEMPKRSEGVTFLADTVYKNALHERVTAQHPRNIYAGY